MIAHFFKRTQTTSDSIVTQQKKNQTIIPRFLNRIWPRWVYLQSSPTNKLFNLHENPESLINVSQRNWTYLTAPGSDHTIQIDPQGLLTSPLQAWSLDVWIEQNGTVLSPSQLDTVQQQFNVKTPSLTTTFQAQKTTINLEAFIIPLPHDEHVACQTVQIHNPTESKLELSCFFAIRPYTPEGVSSIHTIAYHSQNAFLVNHHVGLVLDKKPDNIICLPFRDGDCSEHLKRWEMVLQATCELNMASAVAEYRLVLAPGEKKELSCKIPLSAPHFTAGNNPKLATTITQLQSINVASEKNLIGKVWKEALPACEITLPDTALQALIQKNLFHLVSHSDTYTHKHALELLHILSAQSLFANNFEPEKHFKNAFQALDKTNLYEIGLYTVILLEHFERNPESEWVKKQFTLLQKPWESIIQGIQTKNKKQAISLQHQPTRTLFWVIAGARKAATFASISLQIKDFSDKLLATASTILDHINALSERLEKTRIYNTIIPISETEWTDARLVEALCGVFPLQITDPHSPAVTQTLRWLETNCLINNTILYHQTDPTGLCTHQNARLAQLYVARKDEKAWPILTWLSETASPAGTWPGALHPLYFVGCDGEGHSRETMVEFLRLIRECLISENETTLRITPFIPKTWFDKGLTLRIKNLPTAFGPISIETKHIGSSVEYILSPTFHTMPQTIEISLPVTLVDAKCKGKSLPITQNTATLPGTETSCTLTVM